MSADLLKLCDPISYYDKFLSEGIYPDGRSISSFSNISFKVSFITLKFVIICFFSIVEALYEWCWICIGETRRCYCCLCCFCVGNVGEWPGDGYTQHWCLYQFNTSELSCKWFCCYWKGFWYVIESGLQKNVREINDIVMDLFKVDSIVDKNTLLCRGTEDTVRLYWRLTFNIQVISWLL